MSGLESPGIFLLQCRQKGDKMENNIEKYTVTQLREYISSVPKSGDEYDTALEKLSSLPTETLYKLLNKTQRLFISAYSKPDCTVTQAAREAGLSDSSDEVLCSSGSRMLKNVKVAAYMRAQAREECRALGLTREKCILGINDLARRARGKGDLKNELAALVELSKIALCAEDSGGKNISVTISLPDEENGYAK